MTAEPYAPIERHGVVGDRRTAALVAADGSVDWMCALRFDGAPVLGALLDARRGGRFRVAPAASSGPAARYGAQRYDGDTFVLLTCWDDLEVADVMAFPQPAGDARPPRRNVLLRRLTSARDVDVEVAFDPSPDTGAELHLWASRPIERGRIHLRGGERAWLALTVGEPLDEEWSVARAAKAFEDAREFWCAWLASLEHPSLRHAGVRRSALLVHLLGYAPCGSLVAAATTSLPERPGGDWNADYRFAWVRDASLSLATLAVLGDLRAARRYLEWLSGLDSTTDSPLQVLYRVDGGTDAAPHERDDLHGYRGAKPVRFGNHAFRQKQLDSLGYLLDCARVYLEHGGEWRPEFGDLVRRAAEYTCAHWTEADCGVWELPVHQHYVSSRVMSWVALERAVDIAQRTGSPERVATWRATMTRIRDQVMREGWSDALASFKQRYEGENLDASALLVVVKGFLPPAHARSLATIEAVWRGLTLPEDRTFVYRFAPDQVPGLEPRLPMGEFEGAFLPCTFWLATSLARTGRAREAERIVREAETLAGPLGVFAEGVDPRTRTFRGNTPLLFSQVEYVRALIEIDKATSQKAA